MDERERERDNRIKKNQGMYHAVCYIVPHCQKSKNQNKGTDWNETEQKYDVFTLSSIIVSILLYVMHGLHSLFYVHMK